MSESEGMEKPAVNQGDATLTALVNPGRPLRTSLVAEPDRSR